MFKRIISAVALLALATPTTSWAVNEKLEFYESSVGQGNTLEILGPVSGFVLDLVYIPGVGDRDTEFGLLGEAGIFGFELSILATGEITFDAFSCVAASCTPNRMSDTLQVIGGNNTAGETRSLGPYNLGTLTISGNFGEVNVMGVEYLDEGFNIKSLDSFTLAQVVVPEPGSLVLLGAGLAGLAFLRRRSA